MSDKFSDYPQYEHNTTTDCEDCEARIRAEVVDELVNAIKEHKYGSEDGKEYVIDIVTMVVDHDKAYQQGRADGYKDEKIESIKSGIWTCDDYEMNMYVCSVCQEPFILESGSPTDNKYNYCPNCGARLKC